MKVMLINPPVFENTEYFAPTYMSQSNVFNYPPLGLMYLGSNLDRGHEVRIVDAPTRKFTIENCLKEFSKYDPVVVGMSVFTDSLYACSVLCEKIKEIKPSVRIVWGGPHVNIFPEESLGLPFLDYVLKGFAENTFSLLVNLIEGGKENNAELGLVAGLHWKNGGVKFKASQDRDPSWDIKKVKRPDRGLIDNSHYFTLANSQTITTIISSRGCPFSCTFCDVIEKRYFERDLEDIIAELKEIRSLGIKQVHFFDDCFNLKRDRVMKLCRTIIDNNLNFTWSFRGRIEPCDDELVRLLYQAGCRRVQLGIESTDQPTLDMIKKKIEIGKVPGVLQLYKKYGIETMGYFILGFPFQTYEECRSSCEKIMSLGFDYINMFILIPYPRTEVYQEMLDKKLLAKDYWRQHALDPKPKFGLPRWHPKMSREVLEGLLEEYYRKFYLSPRFLMRQMIKVSSFKSLLLKAQLFFAMSNSKEPPGSRPSARKSDQM